MKLLFKIGALLVVAAGAWGLFTGGRGSLPPEPTPGPSITNRLVLELTVLLTVLAAGGFFVALSGLVSIKASSGHWPITEAVLQFSKQRSVSTHAWFVKTPPLDKPGLAMKGAGQYEIACRPCHGSPELRSPRVANAMTPRPPYLPDSVSKWKPEELFYIVKHGIKFTGMPAWPTQHRDDEVWAMVAFLRQLPNLPAGEYRRLARGGIPVRAETAPIEDLQESPASPKAVYESCGRCHGLDGLGRGPGSIPIIAGQTSSYLHNALQAYARGERHSGIMGPIAAGLDPDSMRKLVNYYSPLEKLRAVPSQQPINAALRRGESIAQRGIPSQRVPACIDCHGPASIHRNEAYPVLSGQYAGYLVLQLTLFKEERRGGSAYAHLMQEVAPRLTPEQTRDVASYYEWSGSGAEVAQAVQPPR
jgi:cytochrome c553